MSSLGHNGTGNHEHAGGKEFHDSVQNEVEYPFARDGIHLREHRIIHGLGTEKISGRPCGHDAIGDPHTDEREGHTNTPEKLKKVSAESGQLL